MVPPRPQQVARKSTGKPPPVAEPFVEKPVVCLDSDEEEVDDEEDEGISAVIVPMAPGVNGVSKHKQAVSSSGPPSAKRVAASAPDASLDLDEASNSSHEGNGVSSNKDTGKKLAAKKPETVDLSSDEEELEDLDDLDEEDDEEEGDEEEDSDEDDDE